jgi:eukaryotic-like serine/threonine-protein kinase
MALFIDPALHGSLALAGLALCLALVGWAWAYKAASRPAVAASDAVAPRQVGPYTLADKIGEGAMGEVYRAWNTAVGGWRAVKLLPRGATERERERFAKEARLGAELRHENTVSIYDSGEASDGTCYYAMELLDGVTLHELVEREGPQPPERVLRFLLQLCAALEEAHGKGLVHRDIKPENVLLSSDGRCTLIDFGLVERVGEIGVAEAEAAVVGTPLYISPEAIVAPQTVGARSDLYGLGALAYFLLRGAPVFQGNSVVEVCGHHLHTPPESLSALLGDAIPEELEQVVMDCLAKDAASRPSSAAELARRLEACERTLTSRAPLPASCPALSPEMSPEMSQRVSPEISRRAVAALGLSAGSVASLEASAPLCLAYVRAQRAFERLDAMLAEEARAVEALAATCPVAA